VRMNCRCLGRGNLDTRHRRALLAWNWFVRDTVEQVKREQREELFGSKRWHWPAAAFLGVLMIELMLLVFTADSR
jgi:hypothetical protein